MKAAIIAGGLGTRIRSVTGDMIPKALVPVAGEPIVYRQLSLLSRYNINQVVFIAGYLANVLRESIDSHPLAREMKIDFVLEKDPLGTAGGLAAARRFFKGEDFLTLYGDVAVEMDLIRLLDFHKKNGAAATIVGHPNDHPQSSDLLCVDGRDRLLKILPFGNRPEGDYKNLVPAAVYALSSAVFEFIDGNRKQDFITDIFPGMIQEKKNVLVYRTPEYLRDMGSLERFEMVERDLSRGLVQRMNWSVKRPVIFFDLDGVINEDIPDKGLTSPSELHLFPRAAKAVKAVNNAGWLAVAVTNRPQLAKGFVAESVLDLIHARMETELGRQGAWLDRVYYCPHHPEKGFPGEIPELKIKCECRKPKTGLLQKALAELPGDLKRSCLIGDTRNDIEAARAMKIPAYGVRTGGGCVDTNPDRLFDDAFDAVKFALAQHGAEVGPNFNFASS